MRLIFSNLPSSVSLDEFFAFAASGCKPLLSFQRQSHIVKCEILHLVDPQQNRGQFLGLVTCDSDKAGQQAIRKLNGKSLCGRMIKVREYQMRSASDKRALRLVRNAGGGASERRRHGLMVRNAVDRNDDYQRLDVGLHEVHVKQKINQWMT